MILLTQIQCIGARYVDAPVWVNPVHVMTVQPRAPRDGRPESGAVVQMVSGWLFDVRETPDIVVHRIDEALR